MRNTFQRSLLTHVFFVSLFLVVPTLAFVRPPEESFFELTRVFVQDTAANFVLLCFFYVNYYLLIPRFYFRKQYVLYVVCVLLFLFFALMLLYMGKGAAASFPEGVMPGGMGRPPEGIPAGPPMPQMSLFTFMFMELRRHLYLFFTAVFFSFLLKTRERLSQLKEEKLQAELTSLKAQINPHFLFNTLNSIYALSVKKDDRASDAIVHLSGLMRYVIKDANDYKIPLQKELEYIANYVELQKARLGNTAAVYFDVSGAAGVKTITPLILITYIENAFKYGVNPDAADCVVDIRLQVTDTGICLRTFNKKRQHTALAESTGIGMQNTGERLKHLYPQQHQLHITDEAESYLVTLEIQLV